MAAFKDENKNSTWKAVFYYKDYQGNRKQKTKRGFKTKKEALEWEREFLNKITYSTDMTFKSLSELYLEDIKNRLRATTIRTRKEIIENRLLPFFSVKKLSDITSITIREWQNILLNNKDNLSETYLRVINATLITIFNHAIKYYGLPKNPCQNVGSIGKNKATEMSIWEENDFNKFIDAVRHKPVSFITFQILFWTGMRIGELLALTIEDIDFKNKTININKSLQRIGKVDIITPPKTEKSIRKVEISDNLCNLIREYLKIIYNTTPKQRLIPIISMNFRADIRLYHKKVGVPYIRLHDLRHSHASYLFNHGIDILTISRRLGHENVQTTMNIYTHLYQKSNSKLLEILNK